MKKYKIGITFNLEHKIKDIWANGINQNIVFLYQLFKALDIVDDVILLSWGPENIKEPDKGFMLDDLNLKFALIDEVIEELDILVEGSLYVEPHHAEIIRKNGGKLVCYKMGNDFIYDIEAFLHDKPGSGSFNGTLFDADWLIPQHINTCSSYFSIMHRCPIRAVPAIWSPLFCDKVIKDIEKDGNIFGYQIKNKDKKSRRIATFESNTIILKNCFTNILIAEQAYRERNDLIEDVFICNAYYKRENKVFSSFIGNTDLLKNRKIFVEGRFKMPDFLARYTDIVLSHQWENGLNYAYNDALYGGYPFIHNSKLLPKGVGYYYDQFDAFDGAKVLIDVIENHDKHHDEYVARANDYLASLHPYNPINLAIYENELKRLFK